MYVIREKNTGLFVGKRVNQVRELKTLDYADVFTTLSGITTTSIGFRIHGTSKFVKPDLEAIPVKLTLKEK